MCSRKHIKIILKLCALGLVFILTGCVGYHNIVPPEFPQHEHKSKGWAEAKEYAEKNLKTVKVYDELQTIALFDFMRYSDEMALASANIKSDRKGVGKNTRRQILLHNLAANQAEFKFLVQADVRQSVQRSLDKKNSPWTFWLETVDGKKTRPTSIKKISHTDITKQFFGDQFSRLKQLYQIIFPLSGNDLEQARIRRGPVRLICRSSQKKCKVSWPAAEGWSNGEG